MGGKGIRESAGASRCSWWGECVAEKAVDLEKRREEGGWTGRIYFLVFLAIVPVYFFAYAFYGYNDADDGYILAFSWRVFNGEVPYRDFIMVKPPLSAWLHALPLYVIPGNDVILFERLFCYTLLLASCLFCSTTITRVFDRVVPRQDPYLLATTGFVFSAHNFPPMAWQTIDGIFFASAGIAVLAGSKRHWHVYTGLSLLFLSALCKQSFYLVPPAGILYLYFLNRNLKPLLLAVLWLAVCTLCFLLLLYRLHALERFFTLTSGSTRLRDLASAGIVRYLRLGYPYLAALLLLFLLSRKSPFTGKWDAARKFSPYLFISFLLIYPMIKFFQGMANDHFHYDQFTSPFFQDPLAQVLLLLAVILFLLNLRLERHWLTLWFLVLLSWCTAISWGYRTPVLCSTPLLFSFFLFVQKYFQRKDPGQLVIFTLALGLLTYWLAYQKPFCNPLRKELTYDLAAEFPKLHSIKVGKDTYQKYKEFKTLVGQYGPHFKTLPGMPLSNYLTNTLSPIPIDWAYNAETNNNNEWLIHALSEKAPFVFMERYPQLITVTASEGKFNSSLSHYVRSHWQKIDSTGYFEVYRK